MRLIQWGLRNPVSINLIMVLILLMGIGAAFKIKRKMFPTFSSDLVQVRVVMEEGSTPDQVDRNIVQLILPKIDAVNGVKEIRSTASEKSANLLVEIEKGYDPKVVKQEIKDEIDTIRDFPEKALDPQVTFLHQFEKAIRLAVYGKHATKAELRTAADRIKKEIQDLGIASQVELYAPQPLEISISIALETLQAKGISIEEIASQIKSYNLELQAGKIRTPNKNITIKGSARKTDKEALGNIPIRFANGEFILLKDLAGTNGIEDGFSEEKTLLKYNDKNAVILSVNNSTNDDIIDLCNRVREYSEQLSLPAGIEVHPLHDISIFVKERLNLIIKNGVMGLFLVIIVLSLFLEWQTALWTTIGITFSLIGALAFLYVGGESLNMISLFAFLMTMGIIVDDAIVIGESFFHKRQKGHNSTDAAHLALDEVYSPVIAMMSSTIIAFIPLLFVSGIIGKFIFVLPIVVITALSLSLFEALFILPVHLAHHSGDKITPFMRYVELCLRPLFFLTNLCKPFMQRVMEKSTDLLTLRAIPYFVHHRYATALTFLALLIFLFGLIPAGIIKTSFFPEIDSDFHTVEIEFERGTPLSMTEKAVGTVVRALLETGESFKEKSGINPINEYFLEIGSEGPHKAKLVVELISYDKGREISGTEFRDHWRRNLPSLRNVTSLQFSSSRGGPGSKPIEIVLSSNNSKALQRAEKATLSYLASVEGVVDIRSSNVSGAPTLQIKLKDSLNNDPINEASLITRIANLYSGIKIDTFYRSDSEVKVYLRGALDDRTSLLQLKNLQLENGMRVGQVANIQMIKEAGEIKRINNQRTLQLYANIDLSSGANAVDLRKQIENEFLNNELKKTEPEVHWSHSGEAKEGSETSSSMIRGYIPALMAIYLILATIFGSYLQPLIIMVAIPFSFVGALIGHIIMDIPFSLMSTFGIVGLTGIAVNDSLVLIDKINTTIRGGSSLESAVIEATRRRFRPILLTSLTTMVSMSPVLFETSFQAQFLIPMVTSIVFGIGIATILILVLIPVGYTILNDWV